MKSFIEAINLWKGLNENFKYYLVWDNRIKDYGLYDESQFKRFFDKNKMELIK